MTIESQNLACYAQRWPAAVHACGDRTTSRELDEVYFDCCVHPLLFAWRRGVERLYPGSHCKPDKDQTRGKQSVHFKPV